jgi:hypothetical protein
MNRRIILLPFVFIIGFFGVLFYDLGEMIEYAKFKKKEKE